MVTHEYLLIPEINILKSVNNIAYIWSDTEYFMDCHIVVFKVELPLIKQVSKFVYTRIITIRCYHLNKHLKTSEIYTFPFTNRYDPDSTSY